MEESELTLETFWKNHFIRLNKCLDLRKFEQKFKDVRICVYLPSTLSRWRGRIVDRYLKKAMCHLVKYCPKHHS